MGLKDTKNNFRKNAYFGVNIALDHVPAFLKTHILTGLACLPYEKRLPSFIMVEPTNTCNIACPLCPVGSKVMKRKRGFMDVDRFRGLIDEISGFVREVVMNFAGETLLHPHIGEIIAYAEGKGIQVTIGTNGTIDKMQEILDAGPTEVLFALDGLTEETYSNYRRGADFTAVKANLQKLTEGKRRQGLTKPNIVLQFVVMKDNEHEVASIMDFAKESGVDEVALTPVIINDFFTLEKGDLISRYLPEHSQYKQYKRMGERILQRKPTICVWAFQSVVLYNGDVTVCCFDFDGTLVIGNAFEGGFLKVWNSEKYRKFRRNIIKRKFSLCKQCDLSYIKPFRFKVGGPDGTAP
jgi:radical SAM protein with 4Fe4S-binding SPASM domain